MCSKNKKPFNCVYCIYTMTFVLRQTDKKMSSHPCSCSFNLVTKLSHYMTAVVMCRRDLFLWQDQDAIGVARIFLRWGVATNGWNSKKEGGRVAGGPQTEEFPYLEGARKQRSQKREGSRSPRRLRPCKMIFFCRMSAKAGGKARMLWVKRVCSRKRMLR